MRLSMVTTGDYYAREEEIEQLCYAGPTLSNAEVAEIYILYEDGIVDIFRMSYFREVDKVETLPLTKWVDEEGGFIEWIKKFKHKLLKEELAILSSTHPKARMMWYSEELTT